MLGLNRHAVIASGLILVNGRHIRAGRALLGWTQEELSTKARVALGTVKRMEGFDGPVGARTETLRKIVAVMEKAGVEFLNDDRPGVRLKGPGKA
jgi:predicted transcriptional regulator